MNLSSHSWESVSKLKYSNNAVSCGKEFSFLLSRVGTAHLRMCFSIKLKIY